MSALRTLALAACLLAIPVSAAATPLEEKGVTSGKVKLDPAMGYVLVSGSERQFGTFIRVPDDEDRQRYEADRLKAFEKAQKRYRAELATWRSLVKAAQEARTPPPEQPEEPRIETFAIDPIELRQVESFGPLFAYSKGSTISYLSAVKPGWWVWYGPIMVGPNGGAGNCYCMGTVKFEVKPGVVTDLGTSLADLPRWQEDKDVARLELDRKNAERVAAGKPPLKTLGGGTPSYGAPASLSSWPVVKAELHASPKMNNYYGVIISRVAPIPGVLGYHRDVIVDERTGKEVDSPTLVSLAKIKK